MKTLRTSIRHGILLVATLILAHPVYGEDNDKVFTRPAMLAAMASNCIVRGVVDISSSADELERKVQQLASKPSEQTLIQAQAAWVKMQMIYKNYAMLSYGPIESQIFWSANFYRRPFPSAMEFIIRSPQPIDEKLIERMGAQVKGFFALEYLLFDSPSMPPAKVMTDKMAGTNSIGSRLLQGEMAARRRLYLGEVVRNLSRHLQTAAQEAQTEGFPNRFAAGGQDSVNLLVNQLTVALESNLILPLRNCLDQASMKKARSDQLEGVASKTTLSGLKASLIGLHNFYNGAEGLGIDDYLQHVNPGLHNRLETQFQATATALDALQSPLAATAVGQLPALNKALEESHKLELLFKVDVVSDLGVTIMFHGYDGD